MNALATALITLTVLTTGMNALACDSTLPIAEPDLVFEEADGLLAVEAEHFYKQSLNEKRAWHIILSKKISSKNAADIKLDPVPVHVAGASAEAYLAVLPDTRANHDQKLLQGENFTDKAGLMAVLSYKIFRLEPSFPQVGYANTHD